MERLSTIEIVSSGGMSVLKEIPRQNHLEMKNRYFDEYATYSPFPWLGSRRLKEEELEDARSN